MFFQDLTSNNYYSQILFDIAIINLEPKTKNLQDLYGQF